MRKLVGRLLKETSYLLNNEILEDNTKKMHFYTIVIISLAITKTSSISHVKDKKAMHLQLSDYCNLDVSWFYWIPVGLSQNQKKTRQPKALQLYSGCFFTPYKTV